MAKLFANSEDRYQTPHSTGLIWICTVCRCLQNIKTLNYNTPPLSCRGQITLSNIDEICPLAIPNQISLILMHVPSLVKFSWHLLKLSSGNENISVSRADNSIKSWRNLHISNPKPDLHNINARTKFGENPLMFSRYHPEMKYGRMDRHTDVPRETIIPCHYRVARYKNVLKQLY